MGREVNLALTTLLRRPFEGLDLCAQESSKYFLMWQNICHWQHPLVGPKPPSQGIVVLGKYSTFGSSLLSLIDSGHWEASFVFLSIFLSVIDFKRGGVWENGAEEKKSFLSYKIQQTMSKAELDEIRALKKVLMGWTLLIRCISSRKCWSDIWSSREGCFGFP